MPLSQIHHVAIVGTGQMGPAIAQTCAMAGYPTTLLSRSQANLDKARDKIRANLQAMSAYELVRTGEIDDIVGRVRLRADGFSGAADADLVIEAISEDLALKQM